MLHISRHYLGDTAEFTPRIPVSQNEVEAILDPRICAAPDIEKCWKSISACTDLFKAMKANKTNGYYFFVYEFDNKDAFTENATVLDFNETGEHVSFVPVSAKIVSAFYVDSYRLFSSYHSAMENSSVDDAKKAYFDWQKNDIIEIENAI
jgi:hypothetical protein